jgi:hypothetical protein
MQCAELGLSRFMFLPGPVLFWQRLGEKLFVNTLICHWRVVLAKVVIMFI